MVLVFDLDDTLYDEIYFVQSGFKNVSLFLENTFKINQNDSYAKCMELLQTNGRGQIFNDLLKYYGIYTKKLVRSCLSRYRLHMPDISLSNEAIRCINTFRQYPKYIVTDGNKIVQKNKIKALNIEKDFKKCIITHNYGKKFSKPNPYVFMKIVQWENTTPDQVFYIGDNPHKDFIGIKPLGFKTIRIINGMFANVCLGDQFEAHFTVNTLDEIDENLLRNFVLNEENND